MKMCKNNTSTRDGDEVVDTHRRETAMMKVIIYVERRTDDESQVSLRKENSTLLS
jgi:hypothetical protein